ncbi:MAG: hypothetical protein D6688_09535 [Alphaproteobacteria bacterium]|nr:MAG: hypothetical protein D6688_09535 [Alphaproteobacteria bacterium]
MKPLRLCVLGNSHVATLKTGWEKAAGALEGVEAAFAGCIGAGMASFDIVDGRLGPREPEAAAFFRDISDTGDFIDPAEFDAFLLVGMRLVAEPLIQNYAAFATPSTHNHDTAPHFVSDGCMADAFWSALEQSSMLHVARTVRRVTDKPVFTAWQAFLSEGLMDIEWRRQRYQPILANKDQPFVHDMLAEMDRRLVAEGYRPLHQPKSTISKGIMTKAAYSRGSVRFRKELIHEHREEDVFHMNADFGAACWKAWARDIQAPAQVAA